MPRYEKVSYWRGKHASIPNALIPGRILFEEDTGHAFIEYRDYTTGELVRKQVTDNSKFDIAGGFGALQTAAFTGPVILAQHPEEVEEYINNNPNLDWSIPHIAATKQYVDDVSTTLKQHSENSEMHIGMHSDISERDYWNQKVDSVEGKGLSTNDYTNAEKTKLGEISKGANKTAFTQVQASGIAICSITIDDVEYTVYAPPEIKDIEGNANTATQLQNPQYIDGVLFDGSKQITHFATCGLSGDVQIKQVYLDDYKSKIGSVIYVLFYNDNTASKPQLKVGKETSYPIKYHNATIVGSELTAGLHGFIFDGSNYNMVECFDTTYSEVTDSQSGLMTSAYKHTIDEMKTKLDTIEEGANNSTYTYTLPAASTTTLGGVVVGENINVDYTGTISINAGNIGAALGFTPMSSEITSDELSALIPVFTGATVDSVGKSGLVPKPSSTLQDYNKYLKGDGTWATIDTPSVSSISAIHLNNIYAKAETPLTLYSFARKFTSWTDLGVDELYASRTTSEYYKVSLYTSSSADNFIMKAGVTYGWQIPVSYALSAYNQYVFVTPDEDFDTESSSDGVDFYFYWEDMNFESDDDRFGSGICRFTTSIPKQFDCTVFRLFEDEYKAIEGRLNMS